MAQLKAGTTIDGRDIVQEHETHLSETVPHFKYDYEENLTYDENDNLTKVEFYKDGVLRKKEEMTYNEDGDLTEVTLKQYEDDGETVIYEHTETLSYDEDGNLESVERSVTV